MFFSPPPPQPPKAPIVTVWIHGSKTGARGPACIAALTSYLSGNTQGIYKITDSDTPYYSLLRSKALSQADPSLFDHEHFYTFGWSGELNPRARKKASVDLFNALKILSNTYKEKYNIAPKFILISHSHGGNVVLHLAEIIDPDGFNLTITKAILLACPVQKHTAHLIHSPLFEKIYSLHSHTDMVQIIDPQGLHDKKKITKPLLSSRHFDCNPRLAQAVIRWKTYPIWTPEDYAIDNFAMKALIKGINGINYIKKNRGLLHIEFVLLPFISQLPAIINQLDLSFFHNNINNNNHSNCHSHNHDIII